MQDLASRLVPGLAPRLIRVYLPSTYDPSWPMGGLCSFWAHFHYPQAFGGALVMSPSFWVADEAIFADIAGQPAPAVSRVYVDGGSREAKGQVVEAVKKMVEHLTARGWDSDRLMWRADAKGTHSEAAWRRRPKALRFIYQSGGSWDGQGRIPGGWGAGASLFPLGAGGRPLGAEGWPLGADGWPQRRNRPPRGAGGWGTGANRPDPGAGGSAAGANRPPRNLKAGGSGANRPPRGENGSPRLPNRPEFVRGG